MSDYAPELAIVDFGGQYTDLIRKMFDDDLVDGEVEIVEPTDYDEADYDGTILSGGPRSVDSDEEYGWGEANDALDTSSMDKPVLGICFGMQLIADQNGGGVESSYSSEFGSSKVEVEDQDSTLYQGQELDESWTWMSHSDTVEEVPDGFEVTSWGLKPISPQDGSWERNIASLESDEKDIYGVQYHPEVSQTEYGQDVMQNFVDEVVKAKETSE